MVAPAEEEVSSSIGEEVVASQGVDPLFTTYFNEECATAGLTAVQLAHLQLQRAALEEVLWCNISAPSTSEICVTMEELGKRRAPKGKKVPAADVRRLLQREKKFKLAIEGPRGVGKTTTL